LGAEFAKKFLLLLPRVKGVFLFRMKPLPKSEKILAIHSDYLPDYCEAGLSNSGIFLIAKIKL
jgi:hypothetical protein